MFIENVVHVVKLYPFLDQIEIIDRVETQVNYKT